MKSARARIAMMAKVEFATAFSQMQIDPCLTTMRIIDMMKGRAEKLKSKPLKRVLHITSKYLKNLDKK